MKVLIVGSGGREHALAWKLSESPHVSHVFVAPGNGGTAGRPGAGAPIANAPLTESDTAGLLRFAREMEVGLTVVGPEAPLAAGLVDAFEDAGLRCFGPRAAAARLEASKSFAKAFMDRHHIPTARWASFRDPQAARAHLAEVDYPVVLKAAGLAAGKGVIVPADAAEARAAIEQIMVRREFGAAGDELIIEERLTGQEASILAFTDGRTVRPLPAAQDHKRAFEGDEGPNTGGMGAYAPAPLVTQALLDEVRESVLQRAVDGTRTEGAPYVGVLYAGLMMTADGPKVLEFNCRFGDPETQAVLPLLASDLADLMLACLDGRLGDVSLQCRDGAAVTVVAASEGYPGSYPKGRLVEGLARAEAMPRVHVFHAGTQVNAEGRLETSGGRVLAVTGLGDELRAARDRAYEGLAEIRFDGMQFRRDIGAKALR